MILIYSTTVPYDKGMHKNLGLYCVARENQLAFHGH